MSSISETGHAKNVDNLGNLIAGIATYGAKYNPANPLIVATALKAKEASARASIDTLNTAAIRYANASNKRESAFMPLNSLVTRALNVLRSSASAENTDATVASIARKITSTRSAAKKEATATAADVKVATISTSQRSFDSLTDNFDRFVEALANIAEYKPNEEELKVEALKAFAAELRSCNNECNAASFALDSARDARNAELYTPNTGLVDVALSAKTYVKALFGVNSTEYKRIASIEFRNKKL